MLTVMLVWCLAAFVLAPLFGRAMRSPKPALRMAPIGRRVA